VNNPRVTLHVRQSLNVEAGLNDGLSVPFLALFLTLAVAEVELEPASYWIRFALEQIGFGILVGVGLKYSCPRSEPLIEEREGGSPWPKERWVSLPAWRLFSGLR
jgi:NhaP-type Na+/H+ or K+/H+ antiporter